MGRVIAMMLRLAGVPAQTVSECYAQTAEVRWRSPSQNPLSLGADVNHIAWE